MVLAHFFRGLEFIIMPSSLFFLKLGIFSLFYMNSYQNSWRVCNVACEIEFTKSGILVRKNLLI